MINKVELAWAAGLYEGEGIIARARTSRFLALSMCDEQLVRRFHEVIGLGTVGGPYPPAGRGKRPYWTWRVCNFQHRQAVTAMLWGWLGDRRREQLAEALAMDKKRGEPGFGKGFRSDLIIKT